MPSPDLEKSLKLADLRKLVREYDEKQEFGDFNKKTAKDIEAQVELLKSVHKLTKTQVDFTNLYSQTEEKRRVDEQQKIKESLKKDGNFKAFLFQQTEGLRKSFHNTWDIKSSDLGKGITKGLSTFGLFGKFDTSGLIRKFDEYKAFTKERQEKVFDVKMLDKISDMILKENASTDDVKKYLQLNGLTNSKIADLIYQFNKGYKESVDRIVNQGVLRFEDTKNIISAVKSKGLLGDGDVNKGTTGGDDGGPYGGIYVSPVEEETKNELVRQGTILDEMKETSNDQVAVMEEGLRLTEEDRNRRKSEKTPTMGLFMDSFKEKFMGGIFNEIGEEIVGAFGGMMTKAGALMGAAAGPLITLAIGGLLIKFATEFAWNWSKANASETINKDLANERKYGGYTKGEEAMAKGYGLNTETYSSAEELRTATMDARTKGVKYDNSFYKQLKSDEINQLIDSSSRLGKTAPTTTTTTEDIKAPEGEDVGVQIAKAKEVAKAKETQKAKAIDSSDKRTEQSSETTNNTQVNVQQKQGYRDKLPTVTGGKGN